MNKATLGGILSEKEDVETLAALGLTNAQAQVFLTLACFEEVTAKTIWKNTGVARQDTYRILLELQKKGLVEKILTKPLKFKALPSEAGFSALLKRKADEYEKIEKKTKKLLDRIEKNYKKRKHAKEYEITIVPAGKARSLKGISIIAAAKKTVNIIDSWHSFKYLIWLYAKDFEKLAKRNAKCRFITDKPEEKETMPRIVQILKEKNTLELRHISHPPPTTIVMADKKKLLIGTSQSCKATHAQMIDSIFSDNPCLAALIQNYFDLMWNKAEVQP